MGFSLYGPYHIGWLIVITSSVIVVSKHFKSLDTTGQTFVQRMLAWFILLFEIMKDIYHAYTNHSMIGEMLYNLFLPGAIAALLFCNWTHRPIYEFMSIFSFIFHLALVMYCVMVLHAGIVQPNKKRIGGSVLFLGIAASIIYPLNKLWGTNFMFLNVPSPGSPLVPLESIFGNPGYIFGLILIFLLLWGIMYLPWKKRKTAFVKSLVK